MPYGRLEMGDSLQPNNMTMLDLTRPELHHKVHQHWRLYPAPSPLWQPILATLYVIIGLLSLAGNGVVLWLFSVTKSLRSGTNLLIMNLALADLLMMFSQFPILILNLFAHTWTLGPLACEVCGFCGALSGTVSINSMALIAFDRYRAIVTPFKRRQLSMKRALLWVVGAWMYGCAWCCLPFFGWNQYVLEGFLASCSFDYLSEDLWSKSYVVALFLAAYILPLLVICVCYIFIMHSISSHHKDISQGGITKFHNLQQREAQLSKVIFTSVFFWTLAWTPYAVLQANKWIGLLLAVVSLLGVFSCHSALTPMTTTIPALFAKLSTVYNPFIYAVSHYKYRKELSRRLPWLCCVLPPQRDQSQNSSTKSDISILALFSRSSSVVSYRNEKAQVDLPSPKTLMQEMISPTYMRSSNQIMAS